jgi:enoyl-[acyl-carrier-protein] reductase (NADH)
MRSIAIAFGPDKIRCNSIVPRAIETDINRDDWSDPKKRAYLESRVPLGRFGKPEDIANVVVFFASDLARYVTGAALLINGGLLVNPSVSPCNESRRNHQCPAPISSEAVALAAATTATATSGRC